MLNRQEFVRCCALSVCAACVPASSTVSATDGTSPDDNEPGQLRWQLDAARVRYAKLIGILGHEVAPSSYKRMLRSLGRECALQYRASVLDKYKGNIRGFLDAIQAPSGWVEKAEYDEAKGLIRIVDRSPKCSCPLVQQGVTPADQCECTLGWQEEAYSRILGRPVKAELEDSILRGGKQCIFRIHIS